MLAKTIEITLPELHYAQKQVKKNASRFNVLDCGRRWGKNVLAIDIAVETILQGNPLGWFEPTYKTLAEVWREIKNTLAPVAVQKLEQEHRIEALTGGVLEMWSLDNPDSARGRKYKRVIINEAGMVGNLGDTWNMIIRPMLADMQGDGWIFSTPKGRNFFWQMYQMGIDPNNPEWQAWQFPTSANPYILNSEIEAMRKSLPERVFQQEINAVFLDDAGGVFRRVMECAISAQIDQAQPGRQYIAGVDVATLVDYTVVSVFDVEARAQVYLDRFNRCDYSVLEDRLHALYNRFNMSNMTVEANSIGQSVIESLISKGMAVIPFTTTSATKQAAIQALQAAFEHGEIKILPDPVQIGELQSYEGERTPSGAWKYSAPEGMHDDTVMAMAIAWNGLSRPNGADLIAFI